MKEPATPRWDRNQWYPEYQDGFEYNPELAAMFNEELEIEKRRETVRYPIPVTHRRKMTWD